MSGLGSVDHLVVLMLENRSFDHMLGFLYAGTGNMSATQQEFDGLTGNESNTDSQGNVVPVFGITPDLENAYWYPLCDPGEGYLNTNEQLFGSSTPPTPAVATNQGFVTNFATALASASDPPLDGAANSCIMGMYTPGMLPVLSALATGFAVCDAWFASVPTETLPNRAFALAGTSLGRVSDSEKYYDTPSIFGSLTQQGVLWKIYGYTKQPLTQMDYPDTRSAPASSFGLFTDFQNDAAAGTLPAFSFLEPEWASGGLTLENDQHPVSNLANGEGLILQVYQAVKNSPNWANTLLVVTYDEHGGCYDHVPPPVGATPPDDSADNNPGSDGFDFSRFGLRVPTILVSPLIAAGTVYRAPAGGPPLDHTSVLATIEKRWGLGPLTERDAVAPDVGSVLTLEEPRVDDPLSGVTAPAYTNPDGSNASSVGTRPTRVLQAHALMAAELPIADAPIADPKAAVAGLKTAKDYSDFIEDRLARWNAAKGR
jgi:phospholipase C